MTTKLFPVFLLFISSLEGNSFEHIYRNSFYSGLDILSQKPAALRAFLVEVAESGSPKPNFLVFYGFWCIYAWSKAFVG